MDFATTYPDIYVLYHDGRTDYYKSFNCMYDDLMEIAAGNLEAEPTDGAIVDMYWVKHLSESDLCNGEPFVLRVGDVQVTGEYFSD